MLRSNTNQSKTLTRQRLSLMTTTGLFAALICLTTAYIFHIPFGVSGGYVHVGDALIYLAASLLPLPYAMIAGAIGGFMADLLTAPIWAPATFLIKMLLALSFTYKKDKIICTRNIVGVFTAALVSFIGYYVAEAMLFGNWAALIPSILGTLVQSGGSAVLFLLFGASLDKMRFKSILKQKQII